MKKKNHHYQQLSAPVCFQNCSLSTHKKNPKKTLSGNLQLIYSINDGAGGWHTLFIFKNITKRTRELPKKKIAQTQQIVCLIGKVSDSLAASSANKICCIIRFSLERNRPENPPVAGLSSGNTACTGGVQKERGPIIEKLLLNGYYEVWTRRSQMTFFYRK